MFEDGSASTAELADLRSALGTLVPAADDAERIDRIRLLEELKGVVAAAQAAETAEVAASQRAAAGRRPTLATDRVEQSIAGQIALARRISPHAALRYVRFARLLTAQLPGTFAALAAGRASEWRALLVARETA